MCEQACLVLSMMCFVRRFLCPLPTCQPHSLLHRMTVHLSVLLTYLLSVILFPVFPPLPCGLAPAHILAIALCWYSVQHTKESSSMYHISTILHVSMVTLLQVPTKQGQRLRLVYSGAGSQ